MCGFIYKKKREKSVKLFSLPLTRRNARTLKLVSLRVQRILPPFFKIRNLFL